MILHPESLTLTLTSICRTLTARTLRVGGCVWSTPGTPGVTETVMTGEGEGGAGEAEVAGEEG